VNLFITRHTMTSKSKNFEKNGSTVKAQALDSVWSRAFTSNSEWPDKVFAETNINTSTRSVIC